MSSNSKREAGRLATMWPRGHRPAVLFGLLAVVMAGIVPRVAQAANTCNGQLSIDYVAGPNFPLPGDVVRVRLTLGTASINGGTKLTINRLRFDLDCNSNFALALPCTDEGSIVEYEGDAAITTTCGVTWNTGHAVSDTPNEVVFTPSSPVDVPAGQPVPPGFCNLEFDVKVLARSTDSTPDQIEEVTGFLASQGDAKCDNGLSASSQQSSSLPLCPTCDDNNECTDNICNQNDGTCTNPPTQASTPCSDTDGNACTTAGCDGAGNCDQSHIVTICPPDGNPCTDDLGCNPQTGQCQYPPTQASTPCPDTDGNACTTAGCDGAGNCDQSHIVTTCPPPISECLENGTCDPQMGQCVYPPKPDSTPCTDTDNDSCTTAGCNGQGTCDQNHIVCVTTTTTTTTSTTTPQSSTTTTVVSSTTTTTQCVPTGPENTSATCSDMIDNDCNGLIDCADPSCSNIFPCLRASKDPTIITFGSAGRLDRIRGHAKLTTAPVDLTTTPVAVLLSNLNGAIYSNDLAAGMLMGIPNGTIFQFRNPDARTSGGLYGVKIKRNNDRVSYTFSFAAYGDLSAATDPNMRLQFYLGTDANAAADGRIFITLDTPWTKTAHGWRAPKDH